MDKKESIYFIEGVAEKDLLGYNSYVDSLNAAIKSGAKFIGLISDYGNGKSTLLDMLEHSEYGNDYDLIKINLWNCDEKDNADNPIDIHRVFLHQLVDKTNIKSKDYYKKKIDKNYSIFDVKGKKKCKLYFISLALIAIMIFFDEMNLIELFSEDKKVFGYFLTALLIVFNIVIYKPVIAYKKADSTKREIDENDTKDLYNEIIEEYNMQNKYSKKTLVICLEELDRYDNCNKVLEYLKEFYKFYRESDDIIFIISIKSATQLLQLNNNKENTNDIDTVKSTYEKLFDYILNLRPVNIHDYDSIVLELLKSKKDLLPTEIKIPETENIRNWKYLYNGENIKIRDIKHRYNFAISLYLSIKENGITPDINKCLFIAYLEDEYNELYNLLISKKDLLNNILIKHASKENINGETIADLKELSKEEIDTIIEGLKLKYISIDYNYYFYKFPLHKTPYDLYEYALYNAIFFDEDNQNIGSCLKNLKDDKILKIIDRRADENILPEIIFKYEKLYILTIEKRIKVLENTIRLNYNIVKNYDNAKEFLLNTKRLPKKHFNYIIELYKKLILPEIIKCSTEERAKIRYNLVEILGNEVEIFSNLFFNDNEVISVDEIKMIEDFRKNLQLINYDKFNKDLIKPIISRINSVKLSYKNSIISFIENISLMDSVTSEEFENMIYSMNLKEYNFTDNQYNKLLKHCEPKLDLGSPNNFNKFINHINYYSKKFDLYYLDILKKEEKSSDVIKYKNTLIKFNVIFDESMKYLNKYSNKHTVFAFNDNLRINFYNNGYYDYYVISTKWEKQKFDIEEDKFDTLSKYYINEYENRKNWRHTVSDNMKEFLYNNVDFSKLDSIRLNIFVDLVQTKEIISSVLKTLDQKFINKYLSKIIKIKKSDYDDIYRMIGNYKSNNHLNRKALNNLRQLTKNSKFLNYLDGRIKVN